MALFNAVNGRANGDSGGYEGQHDISIVHAIIQGTKGAIDEDSTTLLVLALARSVDGSDEEGDSLRGSLWLLTSEVPLNGGNSSNAVDCRRIADAIDLATSQTTYVPTLHRCNDGPVIVAYVSAAKGTLTTLALQSLSTPVDTTLEGSGVVTTSAHGSEAGPPAGLDVLRSDDFLVTVQESSGRNQQNQDQGSPQKWCSPKDGRSSAPQEDLSGQVSQLQRALLAASLQTGGDQSSLDPFRDILANVDTRTTAVEEASMAASVAIADRMPAGQHWGGSSSGDAQLALLLLQEKLRCHERLLSLLHGMGLLPQGGELLNQLEANNFRIAAAGSVCEFLVGSKQEGEAAKGTSSTSPLQARRGRATSRESLVSPSTGNAPCGLLERSIGAAKAPLRQGMTTAVEDAGQGDYDRHGLSLIDAFFSCPTALEARLAIAVQGALQTASEHGNEKLVLPLGLAQILKKVLAAGTIGDDTNNSAARMLLSSAPLRAAVQAVLTALQSDAQALQSHEHASNALQAWRDARENAAVPVVSLCSLFLSSFTSLEGHEEQSALEATRGVLLLLSSPRVAFELAERFLDGEGMIAAVEADAGLHSTLVCVCERLGMQRCAQGTLLAAFLLQRCTDSPQRVRQGALTLLEDIGRTQPEQYSTFLASRPQLRWLHCIRENDHSNATAAALQALSDMKGALMQATDAHTFASLGRLSAAIGPCDPKVATAVESEQTSRAVQVQLTQLTGGDLALCNTALAPDVLLKHAHDFATSLIKNGGQDPTQNLLAIKAALGLSLELVDCQMRIAGADADTAWCAARDEAWALSLRCQEGLWGRLAAGSETDRMKMAQLQTTVFAQLLGVLRDSPDADLVASHDVLQARWYRLSPRIEALSQACDLQGPALLLVRSVLE